MPTVDYDPEAIEPTVGGTGPAQIGPLPTYLVAQLPAAAGMKYAQAVATDLTATSGNAAGGGSHYGIVISDGTHWVIVAAI